jgi:hypothetical protein
MKKIGLSLILAAVALILLFHGANSRANSQLQPYYSGDAISFNGSVVAATANSGKIEIFRLDNKLFTKILEISNHNSVFNTDINFSDLKLNVENGHLYVYAVSEYTLFKYDISDLSSARLEKKAENTYWEWYQRVDRFGDNIVTFSEKGVKVYNSDLEVINSYNFTVDNPYNINSDGNNRFLFAIDGNKLKIYDCVSRSITNEIPLNFTYGENNHKAYYDSLSNEIYVVDDYSINKFDFSGKLLSSSKHLYNPGYEVASNYGDSSIYFSDGVGVVKMTKDSFKIADYAFTNIIGGPQGWAMGLKVVSTDTGDVMVVFNSANILLLDKNMNKISSFSANNYTVVTTSNENLFLNLNRNWFIAGDETIVSGGGFWPNEPLKINLGSASFSSQADNKGRFSETIKNPDLKAGFYDIKVDGVNSGKTYSTSIEAK